MEEEPLQGRIDSGFESTSTAGAAFLLRHPTINHLVSTTFSMSLGRLINRSTELDEPLSDGHDEAPSAGRSKRFLALDVVWNLAFVVVSAVVLLFTIEERPSTPLRVWIAGYALQCLLHVGFAYLDHRKTFRDEPEDVVGLSSSGSHSSLVKRLESLNTIISSFWWMLGFYWIVVGGQTLVRNSPRLYWLAVIFLAFDVFFMIFCIGMACVIFFALFCCIPIVAIAYAMTIKEGASEDDIRILPKYRFHEANSLMAFDNDKNQTVGTIVELGNNDCPRELVLRSDDSECCICLSRYVDGVELYTLPCNHHFHCGCISRWLRINATCPLCKFNILRGDMLV
ncbi:E3 ubiquitin-protein ligase At4g11680-like [Malania oleifera]|uniref:E3 ubiquitin-protein ligase At4g11680-like n=1 Tax=Malania oleifera TaxID=397392 RepID=UPI0025AE417D|nr:E3 ubiquitin-protein ligase At4g11680-like [Malania oleifera]